MAGIIFVSIIGGAFAALKHDGSIYAWEATLLKQDFTGFER